MREELTSDVESSQQPITLTNRFQPTNYTLRSFPFNNKFPIRKTLHLSSAYPQMSFSAAKVEGPAGSFTQVRSSKLC